jgi:dipeptidyl-peptidase 4
VANVLTSDASPLYASGWRPPERVVVKAADGMTDLFGVITVPRDFDPALKYPVIDVMYPGPQGSFAPRTFRAQLAGPLDHLQTFADAGFVVIAVDGRGTAHRSREFRDAFLGTEDVLGAVDHIAAIRNLAAQRPYMDLERVGIRGRSFGGYGALRALLLFPDFFKVAVSATGPADWLDMQGQISVERFFGVSSASAQAREYYDLLSNKRLASRLKGRALLIYGGIDENVPLKQAFAMFDAFIKADKDVDMLILPDSSHSAPKEPYVIRRSLQYFIEHLAHHCGD